MKYKNALKEILFDSQYYSFVILTLVCMWFSMAYSHGLKPYILWFVAFSTVIGLFRNAMTYTETE